MSAEAFFAFARARHAITLARAAGAPRPWTSDDILGTYRFTNVFREMDRVTLWIEKHVRGKLAGLPAWQQVLAVVLARTFNRTETLETIFNQSSLGMYERPVECNGEQCEMCQDDPGCLYREPVAWQFIKGLCSVQELELYMRAHCPSPWVTGAYIVKTPDGMDKLKGALWIVERARERLPALAADRSFATSMQSLHADLVRFPFLGGFTAYEIVSDVRWTEVGRDWPDIMTWAHAGPGAVRGLHRVAGRDFRKSMTQPQALAEMRDLLRLAQDPDYWPQEMLPIADRDDHTAKWGHSGPDWPRWEMREVEHTLCEWDKYERARLGQGRPRGVYR